MVDQWKCVQTYLQSGRLSEVPTIINLRHNNNRVWIFASSSFWICWMKLCCSDNHHTTAPLYCTNMPKTVSLNSELYWIQWTYPRWKGIGLSAILIDINCYIGSALILNHYCFISIPMKTSWNHRFSAVSGAYRNETLGSNGLTTSLVTTCNLDMSKLRGISTLKRPSPNCTIV